MIIPLIAALLGILIYEGPRLIVKKLWRELAAFLFLWSAASVMAIAQFMGVQLPNPTQLLNAIFMVK